MIQEPTQPTLTPSPIGPGARATTRTSTAVKIGLLIAALILLAIPVVMAMTANSNSVAPHNQLAAGATAAPSPEHAGKPNGGPGDGRGKGPRGGPIRGPITIRAVTDKQVSLASDDGWTRTLTVTSTTVITKGGVTIAVTDLKQGDEVGFKETRNADGSYTVVAINVVTPKAGGVVTKIDGNDITVTQRGGTTRVITVTGSTVFKRGAAVAAKTDIKIGDAIDAQGTISGTAFTAISVNIHLAHAGGTVFAKGSDSITVQNRDGSKTVIHVSSTTTYVGRGATTPTLAGIAVGDIVTAEGIARSDGSLDAVTVHAGPPKGVHPPKAPAPATSAAPG